MGTTYGLDLTGSCYVLSYFCRMRKISFQGKMYPTRTVESASFGIVEVGTRVLGDALLIAMLGDCSADAIAIDEQIFFYVDDEVIQYSDEAIVKFLESEVLV